MMAEKREIPIYEKIVDDMEQKIHSGEWKNGQKLPGERELCHIYGVARGTLKAAFAELLKRGLIRQVRGSGTYVEERKEQKEELEKSADELVHILTSFHLGEGEILSLGETVILHKQTAESTDRK